jgi:predicted ATPase/DNA-binding CsgD family transcriptional regulator
MTARAGVPARLSSFVGRRKEMGELRRLFAHTRLLTLLGPGGCGKTRLAVEFAREQESRFADGSIVVELAAVRDPAMVNNAIAAAAGLTLSGKDPLAELSRRLRDKHLLAVVDNCEHVIDAVAASLARLLGDCERISVLATSRERISIDGETAWRVPSLGLPREGDDAESVAGADAVRLFVERARSLRPGFDVNAANVEAVAAICRRLDGVPLAIELAASRVTSLSPAEILPRLEDRFQLLTGGSRDAVERHQTLRAAIDWSYDLLDPAERPLLQRLSVFAGPFSADAAQHICSMPPLAGNEVLDVLQRLVDKSMVQADADSSGELRFRLLETIRDYAARELGDGDAATELRDRHLGFYLKLAEQGFETFKYSGAMREYARLWRDIADVRAALEWSRRDPELEVTLASCLFMLWVAFAPAEGLRRLIDAMGRIPRTVSVVYGRGAWALGALAGRASRPEAMVLSLAEFVEFAEQLDDDFLKVQRFLVAGFTAERRDRDLETARAAFAAALPEMEKYGFLGTLALALASLGSVEMQLGNLDAARPSILRALAVARQSGDAYNLQGAYFQLGWLDLECGVMADAQANFMAALELAPPGDLLSMAFEVEGLGCAEVGIDDRRAMTLFGAAERMRTEIDTMLGVPWALRVKPDMARARAALTEADAEAAWRRGLATPPAEVVAGLLRAGSPESSRRHTLPGGLSRREMEVAGLVAAGMTSKSIADRLFLSERTVESHIEHILTKLDFNSRAQVATWITEQKIGE